jgi:hypothetical protein
VPKAALITAAGVVALTLIGLLSAQLVILKSQKSTTERQLARQVELVRPVVRALHEARPAVREARLPRTARQARRLFAATTPLVEDARARELPAAVQRGGALAQRLLAFRAPEALAMIARAARAALDERLPERVAEAARTARTAVHLARDGLAMQRRLLAIQIEALAVLRESLAIQRQTLQHAESIDRKTGTPAPSALP